MRQKLIGLGVAVMAMSAAAPALACGDAGCAPRTNYNYSGYHGYSEPACGVGAPCLATPWHYRHLANAEPYYYGNWPRYYYVDQGPTYSGPGMFAPTPTYQERAVSGWTGYGPTAYGPDYRYTGGPYGNATTHYYDGMPAQTGPRVYTLQAPVMRHRTRFRPTPKPVPNPRINAGLHGHKIIQVD